MSNEEEALELHERNPGKISVEASVEINGKEDLGLVYTPGVAEPCRKISEDKENVHKYTSKDNLVAVVSDGTAVLGMGDIGAEASMPVMEGKSNLLKKFGEVNGFPVCLDTENASELIETVEKMSPTFGAINLEDIAAPECFKVERTLKKKLDIPVFHDDQHGTAIVVYAALKNALELKSQSLEEARITIIGAGASGNAVANFLIEAGAQNILPVDSQGILRTDDENIYKKKLAQKTLASEEQGSLEDAIEGSDVVIGLSTAGLISKEMVESMAEDPIVFALANPEPEILPQDAKDAGAFITATGRSDFANQVNNSLAFPGVFRGTIDAQAMEINEEMKKAAAKAISEYKEPKKESIVPETLDKDLAMKIAEQVEKAAEKTKATRADK